MFFSFPILHKCDKNNLLTRSEIIQWNKSEITEWQNVLTDIFIYCQFIG